MLKTCKPTSPARRAQINLVRDEVTKQEPERSLVRGKRRITGRNNYGRVTVRYRGRGAKRLARKIDFKRDKDGIPAVVAGIERDPNRNANLALLHYRDGEKRYVVAPLGVGPGTKLESGPEADVRPGNTLPLRAIPVGSTVHNLELHVGRGAQLCRAAGAAAQLMAKEGDYAFIVLPSKETRLVHLDCRATIGQVGNLEYVNISWGKAGRRRHLGIRPHVRGVARNPIDHPMGGGEGKTSGGRHPCSPWGQKSKGLKTRRRKDTRKFIVRRRNDR